MVAMFLTVRRIQAKIQEVNAQVQGLMLDGRAVAIGARRIALDARTNGRLLFSGVRAQAGRVDSLLTETKERARLRFSRRAAGLMARPERDAA